MGIDILFLLAFFCCFGYYIKTDFKAMINEELLPKIKPGAKVRVFEGTTPFEGIVIARKHGSEAGATFTVRSIVAGVGVEKVFPLKSPGITKMQVISSPKKVQKAKLYWVRNASGAKIRQRTGVSM